VSEEGKAFSGGGVMIGRFCLVNQKICKKNKNKTNLENNNSTSKNI
jgi:hypothetical protein